MLTQGLSSFKMLSLLFLLGVSLMPGGCASQEDPLGAEIRKTLGVAKDTIEKTETAVERNYDPQVILKRAEAFYQRKQYLEAVTEYQHFIDLHPLHEWADYAMLKLGLSYYHQIITVDRDPEPIQRSLQTFQKLLSVYPNTKYADEARKKLRTCLEMLAQHELYVGRFYLKKEAYPAALARFDQVTKSYPDLPAASEALYYLGLTYYRQGQYEEASARLKELLERYPDSTKRNEARQLLQEIPQAVRP